MLSPALSKLHTIPLSAIFLLLIISCIAPPCGGTGATRPDVFVSNEFGTGTQGWGITHFSSLGDALSGVSPEGTIHLAQGVYVLDSLLRITSDVMISGEGYGATVIAAPHAPDAAMIAVGRGVTLSLRDITLTGGRTGIMTYGGSVDIERCEISFCADAAIIGIQLFRYVSMRFSSSLVHDCGMALCGISVHSPRVAAEIDSCTFVDNTAATSLWSLPGTASVGAAIVSSLIACHDESPFRGGMSRYSFAHCAAWDNVGTTNMPEGIVVVDPLLNHATYRLDMISPLIDAGAPVTSVPLDIAGVSRSLGHGPDIGAFEGGRVVLIHITDLHLLAPDGDTLYVGVSYEPRPWNAEAYLAGIAATLPAGISPDVVVITGDIVDLASSEATFVTSLGVVSRAQWDDTYKGYLAFKALCEEVFPGVPIYETVGNHDYREHPLYPWTWNDDQGIDELFFDTMSYEPVSIIPLDQSAGVVSVTGLTLVLLNSGHDIVASPTFQETVLYPYILSHTMDAPDIIESLREGSLPSGFEQYIGMMAYGSGFSDVQIQELSLYMNANPSDTYIVACHHPVVYGSMTITGNVEGVLDLCRQFRVPYMLSGHIHASSELPIIWDTGTDTVFTVAGAAMSGGYGILYIPIGSVEPHDLCYVAYP